MSMENSKREELIYGERLTSAVPGRVTGDGKIRELKGLDLAMKLHYIRALYFFPSHDDADQRNSVAFLSPSDIKSRYCLFDWLETYFMTCGRVRPSVQEGAPPVIKLNDAGIRIVEAHSYKTIHDWLATHDFGSLNHHLISNHVLGPDLPFTPLVFLQVTWFKCGGISVGLSWAHILGDVYAASAFMNMLGHHLHGQPQPKVLRIPDTVLQEPSLSLPSSLQQDHPVCIKRVNPVDDCTWLVPTNVKMATHSFWVTQEQVAELWRSSNMDGRPKRAFEVISGVIWKSVAKIRKERDEPKVITVISSRGRGTEREQVIPYNGQVIGRVEAISNVATSHVSELVCLIADKVVDETEMIAERMEKERNSDWVVYGANLTFIDMEDTDVYGFRLKGQSPVYASMTVDGLGDEGAVLVLRGPSHVNYRVLLMLPPHEIELLKLELLQHWCISA